MQQIMQVYLKLCPNTQEALRLSEILAKKRPSVRKTFLWAEVFQLGLETMAANIAGEELNARPGSILEVPPPPATDEKPVPPPPATEEKPVPPLPNKRGSQCQKKKIQAPKALPKKRR